MSTTESIPGAFGAVAGDNPAPPVAHGGRPPTVLFGATETTPGVAVAVYPQRHAYLSNKLGPTIAAFASSGSEISTENFVAFLGAGVYDVLAVFIPGLSGKLPKHQFSGYATQEAMDAGQYDEVVDHSATFPEIVAAFETVWKVNRFDVLGKLGGVVDPTMLKAIVRKEMSQRLSTISLNSRAPSGESDRTSSGTTAPTSAAPPTADGSSSD